MKIAVLDLTSHPLEYLSGVSRVHEQIIAWLKPALPEAEYMPYDIAEGGEPLPAIEGFDGLLLSGSESGVYDDVPWMKPLRKMLVETKDAGKPIYGICFGHQIMADTFGGKAEKSDAGNQLGARKFSTKQGEAYDAYVWHQDQVTKKPPSARVTDTADYCPIAALEYDFPAASVQFHPEYRQAHLRELFDIFRGELVSEEARRAALNSFEEADVVVDLRARETASFFRQHISTAA